MSLRDKIKDWERSFVAANGVKPTSRDIASNPTISMWPGQSHLHPVSLYVEYQKHKSNPPPRPHTPPPPPPDSFSILKRAKSKLDEQRSAPSAIQKQQSKLVLSPPRILASPARPGGNPIPIPVVDDVQRKSGTKVRAGGCFKRPIISTLDADDDDDPVIEAPHESPQVVVPKEKKAKKAKKGKKAHRFDQPLQPRKGRALVGQGNDIGGWQNHRKLRLGSGFRGGHGHQMTDWGQSWSSRRSLSQPYRSDKSIQIEANEDTSFESDPDVAAAPLAAPIPCHTPRTSSIDTSHDTLLSALKRLFGFSSFRPGQEEGIRRILSGHSVFILLPTGAGKSLCYQLAASLFPRNTISLVISPLIALMVDQVDNLPEGIAGGCLHSNQSAAEREKVLKQASQGHLRLLYLSPEMLTGSSGFVELLLKDAFPTIAMACIDEAHCVSEWSHNFRPAYLRLNSVLRDQLEVPAIMALTATATKRTEQSVCFALQIPEADVVRGVSIPDNISLTVSRDDDRNRAIVALLKSPRFLASNSTIVYATTQRECELLAGNLRSNGLSAMAYHAGKSGRERRKLESKFMQGEVAILVATVSFGMGIDKADVRAVMHYSMPRSPEEYVQQIGRAGRDGIASHAHAFLSADDVIRLRSWALADAVDSVNISRFLDHIWACARCVLEDPPQSGPVDAFVVLPVQEIQDSYDMKMEQIETLLVILERDSLYLKLLRVGMGRISFSVKGNVAHACKQHRIVRALFDASDQKDSTHLHVCRLDRLCYHASASVKDVLLALQQLVAHGVLTFQEIDTAFFIRVQRLPDDPESIALGIKQTASLLERAQVSKITAMYGMLDGAAQQNYGPAAVADDATAQEESRLRSHLASYFNGDNLLPVSLPKTKNSKPTPPLFTTDMRVFMLDVGPRWMTKLSCRENLLTPRAIARVFHGIGSPSFKAEEWRTNAYWGRYRNVDMGLIMRMVDEELKSLRGED